MTPADVARFWSHVDVRGPEECWPWKRARSNGYGRFSVGGRRGRLAIASRVAFEIQNGPLTLGLEVLHRCDNPPCCNPAHLTAGTQSQNLAEMVQRGRSPKQKLTARDVRSIRRRRADGARVVDLATEYGVTPSNVSQIATGRTWKHLENAS